MFSERIRFSQARVLIAAMALVWIVAGGCASTKVERVDVGETIDLSGMWNDSDSRMVSDEMITDALSRSWVADFKTKHQGTAPVVIVGEVRNRSDEHINTRTFTKDLERAFVNAGDVDVVASSDERGELREERVDQAANATEATAKEQGQETGADFMLKGSINTITDKIDGKQVKYYQVNLELMHIESNRKVWIGEKKIKKLVKQSRFGF
ncbi:MAG: penicillin-binding protein activator LpoB [Pseudomonadota bacterium]